MQGGYRVRDSAETVGDQHRIDAGILQGDLFTGQTDKLDIEVHMRGAVCRQFQDCSEGSRPISRWTRGVVERQVAAAGANADFQHNAAGEGTTFSRCFVIGRVPQAQLISLGKICRS